MNLPDAPVAGEGFFVTHFFTVRNQEKSKDFYVRILGGKVIKPENPCYIKLANSWIVLNSGGGSTPDKPEVILETPPNLEQNEQFPQSTCRGHLGLLQAMARQRRAISH
jgi:catechol 2,3-dioxygenase-like lactoylglutathione lyase family enzyme